MARRFRDILTLPLFGSPATDAKSPHIAATGDKPAPREAPDDGVASVDLDEIAARAGALMAELGLRLRGQTLQATGWRFTFDRARTRLGCCSYTPGRGGSTHRKVISISRPFADAYGWNLMEDVVRHEIAHALDVDARRRTDHGKHWKMWARKCGADPTRLYEGEQVRLPAKYVAVCPACHDRSSYYRRPRRPGACAACCKRHNNGRYDPRFGLVFYPSDSVPALQLPLFAEGSGGG